MTVNDTSQGSRAEGKPPPTTARAGPDEPVKARLTVNGTPATLRLPARVTLSDALRDHLGLTGTHVGCEHGVCGMCTVLVDGAAARACLLFACQLDGSDIVTVEGLGRPDALHPLQEAFGRNHALQCGFCTPGFLMSSYDLLSSEPRVTEEELPEQLSGVLCRCTGYRNIMSAVAETSRAYPEGVPGPGNCARRALLGRATGQGAPASGVAVEDPQGKPAPDEPEEARIVLPGGEPAATVDITSDLEVSPARVWLVLDDIETLAHCLPGAELTAELGRDRYAGRARVAVGPVRLSFNGIAHVVERDRDNGRLRVLAQGEDAGGGRTQASVELVVRETESGTRLRAVADVYLTGRIAQFGRALAGDISRRMFERFAESLQQAASGRAPQGPRAAPGALRLMTETVLHRLRRLLPGRGRGGRGRQR